MKSLFLVLIVLGVALPSFAAKEKDCLEIIETSDELNSSEIKRDISHLLTKRYFSREGAPPNTGFSEFFETLQEIRGLANFTVTKIVKHHQPERPVVTELEVYVSVTYKNTHIYGNFRANRQSEIKDRRLDFYWEIEPLEINLEFDGKAVE